MASTRNKVQEAQPDSVEAFKKAILARFDNLAKRLQGVAKFVLENPDVIAFETLATIAEQSQSHPSTIVRFAQEFGFKGASQMQRLYRDRFLSNQKSLSYYERIRRIGDGRLQKENPSPLELLSEFSDASIHSLEHLRETINRRDLSRAVRYLNKADTIYVAGFRRSFPVASYLFYALHRINKRVHIIDGLAGMRSDEASLITRKDLLIAVTFKPYASETLDVVVQASTRKANIIAFTDNELSPVIAKANISFLIKEAEVHQFRSLTATLCLAQTLVIADAFDATKN